MIELENGFSEFQRAIINYIRGRREITEKEWQNLLKVLKQTSQNNLYILHKLGVLDGTLGTRKKATYLIAINMED